MSLDKLFEPVEIRPEVFVFVRRCHSECVAVAKSGGGCHLVAVRPIKAGETLFQMEGVTTRQPTRYSLQIGGDLHLATEDGLSPDEIFDRYFWRVLNHSCEPNTVIRSRQVIAIRDIGPWEAVTFNYNTTEYAMAEPFECHCGGPRCLGIIQGFKHIEAAERERLRPLLADHLLHVPETAPASL